MFPHPHNKDAAGKKVHDRNSSTPEFRRKKRAPEDSETSGARNDTSRCARLPGRDSEESTTLGSYDVALALDRASRRPRLRISRNMGE